MYKENLIKLIIKGIIGLIIGMVFVYSTMPDSGFSTALILGFFFAGVPYGWQLFGKITGGLMVIGSIPAMAIAFIIRIMASVLIGWIAYPIALIYTVIKMIKEG